MIPVELINVILSNKGFVILLKGQDDSRTLPISIGQLEAQSIIIALSDAKPIRPLTHDLLKDILDEVDIPITKVEIYDLIEETYYAKMTIEQNGIPLEIDSRPSDAIAMALRCEVPVFVTNDVMNKAGIQLNPQDDENTDESILLRDDIKDEELPEIETLKNKLKEAIDKEDYKKAAKIRDKIKKLSHHN